MLPGFSTAEISLLQEDRPNELKRTKENPVKTPNNRFSRISINFTRVEVNSAIVEPEVLSVNLKIYCFLLIIWALDNCQTPAESRLFLLKLSKLKAIAIRRKNRRIVNRPHLI